MQEIISIQVDIKFMITLLHITFNLKQVKRSFTFVAVGGQTKLLSGPRRMQFGSQLLISFLNQCMGKTH